MDVTPSRESVIWNSRTREAVKGMFLKAQQTIVDLIAEKISGSTCLEDHIYLLNSFKGGSGKLSGMNELYKLVDTAALDVKYETFDYKLISDIVTKNLKTDLRFAKHNRYQLYNADWESTFQKSSFGDLSKKNHSEFKDVTIYVGKIRHKGLFKYVDNKYDITDSVNLIHIKTDLYEEFKEKIDKTTIKKFLAAAYKAKEQKNILMGTLFNAIENGARVIQEEDIDKSDLKKAEEVETRYHHQTYAEREKAAGKVIGYDFSNGNYSQQVYINEDSFATSDTVVIYSMTSQLCKDILSGVGSYTSIPRGYRILGFSEENFKRFKKIEGVKLLTNELYTIKFGDFRLTKLGRIFFSNLHDSIKREAQGSINENISQDLGSLSFTSTIFKDYTLDKGTYNSHILDLIRNRERKIERALEKENAKEIKFDKLLK